MSGYRFRIGRRFGWFGCSPGSAFPALPDHPSAPIRTAANLFLDLLLRNSIKSGIIPVQIAHMHIGAIAEVVRIIPDDELARRARRAAASSNRRCQRGRCSGRQLVDRLRFFLYRCAYCGVDLRTIKSTVIRKTEKEYDVWDHNPLVFDHRIPVSRGGTGWPSNIVPACIDSDIRKGSK